VWSRIFHALTVLQNAFEPDKKDGAVYITVFFGLVSCSTQAARAAAADNADIIDNCIVCN